MVFGNGKKDEWVRVKKKWNGMEKSHCDGDELTNNIPAGIFLLKVNNRNSRTRCEICSKLTIKTPERRLWRRYSVFIVNFEHIWHLALVFLLLTWNANRSTFCSVLIVRDRTKIKKHLFLQNDPQQKMPKN